MKEHRHLGVYGLIVKDNKILLIKKVSGPYDGLLDLPGGSLEFGERPMETLKRELEEETGIIVKKCELFDTDSVVATWLREDGMYKCHHVGIFYRVNSYSNEIKKNINIDEVNDDSLGADFYDIDKLTVNDLSLIALLELKKLGYDIKE